MVKIDNEFYKQHGDIWWQPDSPLNLLQTVVNPGRVGYFKRIVHQLGLNPQNLSALEVGCGGGILCEEIARMGFQTTGMDPSAPALMVAAAHAEHSGLKIKYLTGSGEVLPFPDGGFDVLFCCDVLEHVQDLVQVIAEIARVLKPGGWFFFDTLNRTPMSKLIAIKVWQDWSAFAFMPKNLHVWEMFIKPAELKAQLKAHGFEPKEIQGLAPASNPLSMLYHLYRRAKGRATYQDLVKKFVLKESRDKSILYLGYAQKSV